MLQEGDIVTAEEAKYIEALEQLWDALSDAIECGEVPTGQLRKRDYLRLVRDMVSCEQLRHAAQVALEREGS